MIANTGTERNEGTARYIAQDRRELEMTIFQTNGKGKVDCEVRTKSTEKRDRDQTEKDQGSS